MNRFIKKLFSLLLVISMILSTTPVVRASSEDLTAEILTAPSAAELTYDGTYQPLVNPGLAGNGTVMYSLVENDEFTADIPTAKNAGTYTVYYYAQGNAGYTDSEVESVDVTVEKADAVIVKAPTANTLVYNGTSQALIVPGEASGGVMMYNKLNNIDRGFSADIPTGNMGYYDVWYYVKGDENHNNSAKFKVGVTIEKAVIEGPIEVEIATPVPGAAPQNAIYRDLYSAQIIWSPSVSVFEANQEYQASVTVSPKISRAYRFDTAEAESFISKMRSDGWTVYGNENSISMNRVFSTAEKTKVTVTAQNQIIRYGQSILGNAYYYSSEDTGINVSAKLVPSTEHVTVNGTITLTDVVITENGVDITSDCEITLKPGKLVIEPDVSKIQSLTTENVTGANAGDIEAVLIMMASAQTDGADEETKKSWDDIVQNCQELQDRIAEVQSEIAQIEQTGTRYDPATVTSADEDVITESAKELLALLETQNLTPDERTRLEDLQAEFITLLITIDAASTVLHTADIQKAREITPENVKPEDKPTLDAALRDLENALSTYAGNYTESELTAIQEDMDRIKASVALLEQAERVAALIKALPEVIEPDDEEAIDQADAAKAAYDSLTDHGKSLIDEDLRKKLENLEIKAPEEQTIPVYRLYNPYTQEHLLTGSEAEKDSLLGIGWTLDGVAWNAPEHGTPVYRLYNPYDDWHTYSTNQEEIELLTTLGWVVDGVVTVSASSEDGLPIYRLFNPYEQKNYHLFTASSAERDFLTSLGWKLDGIAWFAAAK